MSHGPCVLIENKFYEVRPSCEHILGFVFVPEMYMGYEPGEPVIGPCRLQGTKIDVSAHIQGWRDVSCLGVLGIKLQIDDVLHMAAFLGCLIVQNQKVVGIVQATHKDMWGYPFDLLLERAKQNKIGPMTERVIPKNWGKSLLLIEEYDEHFYKKKSEYCFSAAWQCHVIYPPTRDVDFNTVNGVISQLEISDKTTRQTELVTLDFKLPSDTRCLNLGGLIIHPGSVIDEILPNAEIKGLVRGRITKMNHIAFPSIDQIINILTHEKAYLLMVGDYYARFAVLKTNRPCAYARHICTGVYIWGFAAPASDVEYDPMPDDLSVVSIAAAPVLPLAPTQVDLLLLDLRITPPPPPLPAKEEEEVEEAAFMEAAPEEPSDAVQEFFSGWDE